MREGSKCLRPHDTKVSDASKATQFRKDSVEDVSKKMQTQAGHDGLTTLVAVRIEGPVSNTLVNTLGLWFDLQTIRYDTEAERHWDLEEETD